jgi:hypothetical protein
MCYKIHAKLEVQCKLLQLNKHVMLSLPLHLLFLACFNFFLSSLSLASYNLSKAFHSWLLVVEKKNHNEEAGYMM